MMFGSVVPELKEEAEKLTREIARLDELKIRTAEEQTKLKDNLAKLTGARTELLALQARKKSLLAETGDRLEAEKRRAQALAGKAKDLKELLAGLERDRLKAEAEAKARAEAAAEKAAAGRNLKLAIDEKAKAEAEAEARRAAERAKKPHIAFADAQGSLHYPAQGRILKAYGVDDGFGGRTRGLFVATRAQAQVVSPPTAISSSQAHSGLTENS